MASAITHALIGGAIGLCFSARWGALGRGSEDELEGALQQAHDQRLRRWLPWVCAFVSVAPDFDVAMHVFVRYSDPFGHRGAFHSIPFYAGVATLAALSLRLAERRLRWALAIVSAMTSHSLLDMLTNGGLGIALFWPVTAERWFFPWRPIPVSPISVMRFFSEWGLRVLKVELLFAVPLFALAWGLRRKQDG